MKKYFSIVLIICLIFLTVTACSDDNEYTASGIVDLTVLSDIMVYSKVYDIISNPDDYMGKIIKVNGPYVVSLYEGEFYHFVLVEGADACCQEGLMFKWNGNHVYPDDYPAEETKIEITGEFSSFELSGNIYYYLAVDDVVIL